MSNDQGNTHAQSRQSDKKPTYYIKQFARPRGAPSWVIYERLESGTGGVYQIRAVCVCYNESTALRIMRLLITDDAGNV
jgi:hypothetical protein